MKQVKYQRWQHFSNNHRLLIRQIKAVFKTIILKKFKMDDGNENNSQKKDEQNKPKRIQHRPYTAKNKLVSRPKPGPNIFFIKRKASFKSQLNQCCDMLRKGHRYIIIHGLGSAIHKCCILAMEIEKTFPGTCQVEVNTGTADLADDHEPVTDDVDYGAQVRNTFNIHIRISRTTPPGASWVSSSIHS